MDIIKSIEKRIVAGIDELLDLEQKETEHMMAKVDGDLTLEEYNSLFNRWFDYYEVIIDEISGTSLTVAEVRSHIPYLDIILREKEAMMGNMAIKNRNLYDY